MLRDSSCCSHKDCSGLSLQVKHWVNSLKSSMATLYVLAHPQLLLHPGRLLSPKPEDRKQIERLCAFLGNAEGRDKIGKLLQFFARFLDGFLREGPGAGLFGEGGKETSDQVEIRFRDHRFKYYYITILCHHLHLHH